MLNLLCLVNTIVKRNGHRRYSWNRDWQESFKKFMKKVALAPRNGEIKNQIYERKSY